MRATWPDLPIPVTTTRPVHESIRRHAAAKLPSTRAARADSALASVSMTETPEAHSAESLGESEAGAADTVVLTKVDSGVIGRRGVGGCGCLD